MTRSRPLPYLEAYPLLQLSELQWDGKREVSWYNEHRVEVGHAVSEWIENYKVRLAYSFQKTPEIDPHSGVIDFQIEPKMHGIRRWRQTVTCRGCAKLVTRLVFRNIDWLCAGCQGLRNRSTYLTPAQRYSEEHDQLRREIGEGRPPGMREAEYQEKNDRLAALKPRVKREYRRAPVDFYGVVHAKWR